MSIDPLKQIEDTAREVNAIAEKHGRTVFERYPLTFSLLVVFGFAAVVTGFEEMVKHVPFLAEHPIYILLGGIALLLFTGTLYKKLQAKN